MVHILGDFREPSTQILFLFAQRAQLRILLRTFLLTLMQLTLRELRAGRDRFGKGRDALQNLTSTFQFASPQHRFASREFSRFLLRLALPTKVLRPQLLRTQPFTQCFHLQSRLHLSFARSFQRGNELVATGCIQHRAGLRTVHLKFVLCGIGARGRIINIRDRRRQGFVGAREFCGSGFHFALGTVQHLAPVRELRIKRAQRGKSIRGVLFHNL